MALNQSMVGRFQALLNTWLSGGMVGVWLCPFFPANPSNLFNNHREGSCVSLQAARFFHTVQVYLFLPFSFCLLCISEDLLFRMFLFRE